MARIRLVSNSLADPIKFLSTSEMAHGEKHRKLENRSGLPRPDRRVGQSRLRHNGVNGFQGSIKP